MVVASQWLATQVYINAGGAEVAAEQVASLFKFRFGLGLKGTRGAMNDVRTLFFGAGDVYTKFIKAPLDHIGVKTRAALVPEHPADTNNRVGEEIATVHPEINYLTFEQLAAHHSPLNPNDYDFVVIMSPPDKHLENIEMAFKLGLPCMVEKPTFLTYAEYQKFVELQKQYGIPVYFMDWEVPLATPLYLALGHEVPFSDCVTFENGEGFAQFNKAGITKIDARFVEGGDNPLGDVSEVKKKRPWVCKHPNGVAFDMLVHSANAVAVALELENLEVINTVFGKHTEKKGVYKVIGKEETGKETAEMYVRIEADADYNGRRVPMLLEAGKNAVANDMRIDLTDDKGNLLRYRFGHETSVVELFDKDGKPLAKAESKADPYAFMFIHAAKIFKTWRDNGKNSEYAHVAFGEQFAQMIKLMQDAHEVGRAREVAEDELVSQLALNAPSTVVELANTKGKDLNTVRAS